MKAEQHHRKGQANPAVATRRQKEGHETDRELLLDLELYMQLENLKWALEPRMGQELQLVALRQALL